MTPGGYAGTDAYNRSYRAVQSADFFCGVVPGSVLSQLGKAMNLEGAAGLAMKRLSREGLAWVPTAGNLCTLLAFGIALYINSYLTGGLCASALLVCSSLFLTEMVDGPGRLVKGSGQETQRLHAWTVKEPAMLIMSALALMCGRLQMVRQSRC